MQIDNAQERKTVQKEKTVDKVGRCRGKRVASGKRKEGVARGSAERGMGKRRWGK